MLGFVKEESGNIAVMTALTLGIILSAMGIAIDTMSVTKTKARLQQVADVAALAGANAAETNPSERAAVVRQALLANLPGDFLAAVDGALVTFDDETERVTVGLPYTQKLMFGPLAGISEMTVAPSSTVSYTSTEPTPISIAFALDVSGSMGWDTSDGQVKLDVLKVATADMFAEIYDNARRPELLDGAMRTSMATYNTELVTSQGFEWGSQHISKGLQPLVADGGTDSSTALRFIYDQLLDDRITRQIQTPDTDLGFLQEFAIFMTDGDNNEVVADEESAELCRQMRDEGIEVYSVAFAAPMKGQALLLDCASFDVDRGLPPAERKEKSKCRSRKGVCGKSADAPGQVKKRSLAEMRREKETYFFDADNGEEFRASFAAIGKDISRTNVVIKS